MKIGAVLHNTFSERWETLKKYPLFFVAVLALCIYLSIMINSGTSGSLPLYGGLLIAAIGLLGGYTAIGAYDMGKNGMLMLALPILMALVVYFLIPDKQTGLVEVKNNAIVFMLVFILHLSIAIIPFYKAYEQRAFLQYNVKLLENYCEASLLYLIFYGILCLAVLGITRLFDININGKIYLHLFVWIAGIFHTSHFMSQFPELQKEKLQQLAFNSRFFKTLVLYILIPSTLVYAAIIYAYTIKLLAETDLKPWLLEMCLWYVALGMLTYYLSKVFAFGTANKWVDFYLKFFPYISIIVLIAAFYACYHKLAVGGVTESNYFLAMLTVAAGIGIFPLIFNRINPDFRWLPLSLMIMGLMAVLPHPFNVWNATIKNQTSRLEEALQKNGVLKEGKLNVFKGSNFSGYDTVSTALYNLEHLDGLKYLTVYDKDKVLSSPLYAYDVMQRLNIQQPLAHEVAAAHNHPMQTLYFEFYPNLAFKDGDTMVALLNRYSVVQDTFQGLQLNDEGQLMMYQDGKSKCAMTIEGSDFSKQKILLSGCQKELITLYFTNLVYRYNEGKLFIEDLTGIAIKSGHQ